MLVRQTWKGEQELPEGPQRLSVGGGAAKFSWAPGTGRAASRTDRALPASSRGFGFSFRKAPSAALSGVSVRPAAPLERAVPQFPS